MSKFIDLTGQKFGEWTVLFFVGNGKWTCQCSCGTIKNVYGPTLRNGTSKSCGCKPRYKEDLTGKKFGEWTVLSYAESRQNRVFWNCICSCGTQKQVSGELLRRGGSKSCGGKSHGDLTGKRFERLVVLRELEPSLNKRMWLCKCDCGKEVCASTGALNSGNTKSCGCYSHDKFKEFVTKHGLTNTLIYYVWINMRNVCYNQSNPEYRLYGGRGIKVCDEWKDDFKNFYDWAMDSGYKEEILPSGVNYWTIERIDNDGNFEPDNCCWANREVQANNRQTNHLIRYDGKTFTMANAAKKYNIHHAALRARIFQYGFSLEEAIETPTPSYAKRYEYNGKNYTASEMSKKYNININTFRQRLHKGWSIEKIIETPVQKKKRKDGLQSRLAELKGE